jgi:hypothetical protein
LDSCENYRGSSIKVNKRNILSTSSGDDKFNINVEELKRWIASLLYSGLCQLPSWRDYWDSFHGIPKMQSFFSRNRWEEIKKYFRIESVWENRVGLDKVEFLYTYLQSKFASEYYPTRKVVVDEGIVPFKGRIVFRQYIPRKPKSTGIKIWMLCDSAGYLWKFEIYTGKKGIREKGLAASVVESLVSPLEDGHEICTDSYFSSFDVAAWLHSHRQNFIFTLKKDKLKYLKFVLGTSGTWIKNDVASICSRLYPWHICAWQDTALVVFMSNYAGPSLIKDGNKIVPSIAYVYRHHYHAVDNYDKNHLYLRPNHRTVKWYWALFLSLLKFAVLNAWAIWKSKYPGCSQKDFVMALIKQLSGVQLSKENKATSKLHLVVYSDQPKRCVRCHNNSNFFCETCQAYLHPKYCFKEYHDNKF